MQQGLIIAGTTIRVDAAGRYCLNDLYRVAGSLPRHRPSLWLRSDQAQGLVQALVERQSSGHEFVLRNPASGHEFVPAPLATEALRKAQSEPEFRPAPVFVEPTKNPGTYVVRELVYAYAMWISPEFNLRVIEAYDALVTGEIAERSAALNQAASYWFARRPHWPAVHALVLEGLPYARIGERLGRSRDSVRRAVAGMIMVGLLAPARLVAVQRGVTRRASERRALGWGQLALPLGWGREAGHA